MHTKVQKRFDYQSNGETLVVLIGCSMSYSYIFIYYVKFVIYWQGDVHLILKNAIKYGITRRDQGYAEKMDHLQIVVICVTTVYIKRCPPITPCTNIQHQTNVWKNIALLLYTGTITEQVSNHNKSNCNKCDS
jgi:hypothetical protein